jgi:hypothetical protein
MLDAPWPPHGRFHPWSLEEKQSIYQHPIPRSKDDISPIVTPEENSPWPRDARQTEVGTQRVLKDHRGAPGKADACAQGAKTGLARRLRVRS